MKKQLTLKIKEEVVREKLEEKYGSFSYGADEMSISKATLYNVFRGTTKPSDRVVAEVVEYTDSKFEEVFDIIKKEED